MMNLSLLNAEESAPLSAGDRIQKESIILHDKEIQFYKTFTNRQVAFENMKTLYANEISYLQTSHSLEPFMIETKDSYEEAVRKEYVINIDETLMFSNFMNDLSTYRHEDLNNRIQSLYDQYLISNDDNLLLEIDLESPSYSDKLIEKPSTKATFNRYVGIEYAIRYAESYNGSYRYFDGADCTNYASQITHAGGIPMTYSSNPQSGWYYRGYSDYSRTWTLANRFVNWYGIQSGMSWYGNTNKSTAAQNHYNFSANLHYGYFISIDFSSDGEFDHVSFVTESEVNPGTWRCNDVNGTGCWNFYDYKVAQHTPNYFSWASWWNAEPYNMNWPKSFYRINNSVNTAQIVIVQQPR